ncbi:MAG: excinuclease ABC subunit UvrC [Thermoprotei archaeon]
MALQRTSLRHLPDSPGVYIFKDAKGEPLYIGKSTSIRKRVEQHYSGPPVDAREGALRRLSEVVEYIKTRNEVEALILENNLIKKFRPPLNVMLKDDKTYPYIKLTKEEYPRVVLTRRLIDDGSYYFGPYTSPSAARLTIKQLRAAFPIRGCSLELGEKVYRPCLDYHIKICSAPCAKCISKEDYDRLVRGFVGVLRGSYKRLLGELYREMESAAERQQYEVAALLRDRIRALEILGAHQYAQLPGWAEYDVISAAGDAGVVLHFRRGALVGREVFRLRVPEGVGSSGLIEEFIQLFYSAGRTPANTVIVEGLDPKAKDYIEKWLKTKNPETVIRGPQTRVEAELINMCRSNLPSTSVDQALAELGGLLNLPKPPNVIYGFDVSNLGSSHPYVSAVCFVDGSPARKHYRVYAIRGVKSQNDFAMIREAVVRHMEHVKEGELPAPNLILIDGGPVQRGYAVQALRLAHASHIPVISLAKRFEVVYTDRGELHLPLTNRALQILQHIRDESHRFALKHHRKKRRKATLESVLMGVRGLGPKRLQVLSVRYRTLDEIVKAGVEGLLGVPGISRKLAERIVEAAEARKP